MVRKGSDRGRKNPALKKKGASVDRGQPVARSRLETPSESPSSRCYTRQNEQAGDSNVPKKKVDSRTARTARARYPNRPSAGRGTRWRGDFSRKKKKKVGSRGEYSKRRVLVISRKGPEGEELPDLGKEKV